MEPVLKTEQNTQAQSPKERFLELVLDSEIQSLITDISLVRFGEPVDFTAGNPVSIHSAMQKVFNLRRPGGERRDREDLPDKEKFTDRIYAVAEKYGLVGDTFPKIPNAQAAIILGGAGKSPLDRAMYTKELIDNGSLITDTIILLGSSRPVNDDERQRGGSYANNALDEYGLMKNAAHKAFGVDFDDFDELVGYEDDVAAGFENSWKISYAKSEDEKNIFLLSAPMLTDLFHSDGKRRPRANTADTYKLFAKVAQFEEASHVIAVTNQHFVPFQGADAVKELSEYNITAEAVGFDPSHFGNKPKEPEELLQEILSAMNSLARVIYY